MPNIEHLTPASADSPQKPAVRIAHLATGVALPYLEQGPPNADAVVFLHGYTDSCRSYEPVLPHLPSDVRALVPTLRGHGDAERPASGYRLEDFAADVSALLNDTGVTSAVIVGHSMGAHIAQRFAADYPECTSALVLEAAFYDFASNPGVAELVAEVGRLTDPIDAEFARAFQLSTLARSLDPAFLELVVAESCKLPARVWQAVLGELVASDLTQSRRRIRCPTLLVWGAHDAFVPKADQLQLMASLARAELREYRDAGHAAHWEEPARFAADVAGFAHSLRPATTAANSMRDAIAT